MKNKKGFTLVELLAVIAILAILVIIALPNVINMYNKAQKETFLTEVKKIHSESEKKYISSSIKGDTIKTISSKDDSKLDMTGEKLQYCVILNNSGKVTDMKVSNGKWVASLGDGKSVEDLTINDLEDGNLDGYECGIKMPKSFGEDSWETIVESVRNGNDGAYNVGDTKEINLGEYGTHTVRIANTSTPSECSTEGFSQTACGFVLEFTDIITKYQMNTTSTNVGGWTASSMKTFVNSNIYNLLPVELQNGIIDTTVVSGHGKDYTDNFISTDKFYLLSAKEIYEGFVDTRDASNDFTRQLDYYKQEGVTTSNYGKAAKKYGSTASSWWLRSAISNYNYAFSSVISSGNWGSGAGAINSYGVSPAFRIG